MGAILYVPPFSPYEVTLTRLKNLLEGPDEVLSDMTVAPALLPEAAARWFNSDTAILGDRNELAAEVVRLVAPMMQGGPHWRCAQHALLRTPACGREAPAMCHKQFD